ncbi:MAG: hypothetical protein ACI92C_000724 [Neolewinella sp.]
MRFLPHQQSKFTRSRNTFYLIRVPKQPSWAQHSPNSVETTFSMGSPVRQQNRLSLTDLIPHHLTNNRPKHSIQNSAPVPYPVQFHQSDPYGIERLQFFSH